MVIITIQLIGVMGVFQKMYIKALLIHIYIMETIQLK